MRKLVLYLFVLGAFQMWAQDEKEVSIGDFNFESTTNSAFLLLGETPTAISTPNNLKSLALYLSNGFSNSNIALEINPYWLFWSDKDTSYEDYRGIKKRGDKEIIQSGKKFETNSSISIAYLDKKFEGLPESRKVFAIGGRFTFYEYYGPDRTDEVVNVVKAVSSPYSNRVLNQFNGYLGLDEAGLLTPDPGDCETFQASGTIPEGYRAVASRFFALYPKVAKTYKSEEDLLKDYFDQSCGVASDFVFNQENIKPIFRLDGALGYSYLFKENDVNASTANRFASWLTADVAFKFNDARYIHILAIGKYVDDGFQRNEQGLFFTENFWDYGAKIEMELDRFSFSYEYLERSGDGAQFRSVGNITYQINKTMSITGGFGKDFPLGDNLISLIGVNWGLNAGEKPFGAN